MQRRASGSDGSSGCCHVGGSNRLITILDFDVLGDIRIGHGITPGVASSCETERTRPVPGLDVAAGLPGTHSCFAAAGPVIALPEDRQGETCLRSLIRASPVLPGDDVGPRPDTASLVAVCGEL